MEPGERVLRLTAAEFGLTAVDLRRQGGPRRMQAARQLAAYVMRERLRMSFPSIGRVMNRDHTTVMYNVRRAADRLPDDAWFDRQLVKLLQVLDRPSSQLQDEERRRRLEAVYSAARSVVEQEQLLIGSLVDLRAAVRLMGED